MGKRNGKKQYYGGAAAKRGKFQSGRILSAGMAGFLITCNMREREATNEAYSLLNEYADRLVGPEAKKAKTDEDGKPLEEVGQDKQEEEENYSDDDDIDAALEKEKKKILEVVNIKREERRFNKVDTGAKNCIFIKTTLQNSCEIVSHIIEDISVKKEQKSRYILRLIPVIGTCKAHEKNMTELLESKIGQVMEKGKEISYCVIYKSRNNNEVKQHDILNLVNSAVKEFNPSAVIELKTPQLCLYVEIIRNIFCLGVARDYFKNFKYNLEQMSVKDEPDTPATTDKKTTAKDNPDNTPATNDKASKETSSADKQVSLDSGTEGTLNGDTNGDHNDAMNERGNGVKESIDDNTEKAIVDVAVDTVSKESTDK